MSYFCLLCGICHCCKKSSKKAKNSEKKPPIDLKESQLNSKKILAHNKEGEELFQRHAVIVKRSQQDIITLPPIVETPILNECNQVSHDDNKQNTEEDNFELI